MRVDYKLKELYNINPILNDKTNEIIGNVLYVDNYENVVTNISKTTFFEFGKSILLQNINTASISFNKSLFNT